MRTGIWVIVFAFVLVLGCKDKPKNKDKPTQPVENYTLSFSEDSAYKYIEQQVEFGPRVPGTDAHKQCAEYLVDNLKSFCDTAFIQIGEMPSSKGSVAINNIIGSFNPTATKRILLMAHWDTRPQADEDKSRPSEPADGANDGASGVGVLLEIARQLQAQRPDEGVDIIFFDAEDMGDRQGKPETWCLGSQYWAKNKHKENYVARFGILLDMVAPENPTFAIEGYSWQYAQPYVKKVWKAANELGYGQFFVNNLGASLIDDHVFVNQLAGIPTLDIIHYDNSSSGFGEFWHTHDDNMESISKSTLKAVGETVFKVVKDF